MPEDHIATVRRYIDIMNRRDLDALPEVLTEDHVWHSVNGTPSDGIEGFRAVLQTYLGWFPDVRMEVHHIFGDGEYVGVRQTHRGTHSGEEFLGRAPSGKPFEFVMHLHARMRNGKIAEVWEMWNFQALLGALDTDAGS